MFKVQFESLFCVFASYKTQISKESFQLINTKMAIT